MANKVNNSAPIPSPIGITSFQATGDYLTSLVQTLANELRDHAYRLNAAAVMDGSEAASAPMLLNTYLKSALPSAAQYVNGLIIVSNDVGGLTLAFSDGTNWRRTADRNVIS